MHDATARGGWARVHLDSMVTTPVAGPALRVKNAPAVVSHEYLAHHHAGSPVHDDPVDVFLRHGEGGWEAESYTAAGRRIRFCGHGALAAAFVAAERTAGCDRLAFSNREQSWRAHCRDGQVTLIYKKPQLRPVAVPEFAAPVFGALPVAAAEAGGPEHYLVLEFSAGVQALAPDFARLAASTRRAVIATEAVTPAGAAAKASAEYTAEQAASGSSGAPAVRYRYFAPQYGVPEDPATGSAAVQLAAYWRERAGLTDFSARQVSAGGACLHLGCRAGAVHLTAPVGYG